MNKRMQKKHSGERPGVEVVLRVSIPREHPLRGIRAGLEPMDRVIDYGDQLHLDACFGTPCDPVQDFVFARRDNKVISHSKRKSLERFFTRWGCAVERWVPLTEFLAGDSR